MKKVPFKSGIHPNDGKEFAKDKQIIKIQRNAPLMVYPLSQHIGAPAAPVVSIGDRVLQGQMIAKAASFVSSPVFSSVSGTVKAIENRVLFNGTMAQSLVVENDFQYETTETFGQKREYKDLSAEDIKKIISDSGIVGMGGAGFPTGVKLSPKNADNIDYVIINGAECEPYLTSDYRIMLEKCTNVLTGLEIILRIFKNAKGIIAIEDNKQDAVKAFESKLNDYQNISVIPLKTRYPQGGERRLIASVTGRKINSHLLPADAGVVVVNIATVNAIYDAVCNSIPLIHRVVTVTGNGAVNPGNYDILLGNPASLLIEDAGGLKADTKKIISGGPMMGFAMPSLDYPITKTFSSVLALTNDDVENMKTTACIRCGRCVGVCPENLVPQLMAQAAKNEDVEQFEKLGGMECIECGCCTYVCPAKRPLTQSFKLAKAAVRETKKAK